MAGEPMETTGEIRTASWWGRTSGDARTIHCAQNGWREAIWKRKRGKWYEAAATIRPVIAVDLLGNVTLGDPRTVNRGA